MNFIPYKIQLIWNVLEHSGYPTYLVGGAVRDFIIGGTPKDFDLATKAKPDQIVEVLAKHFPSSKVDYVGASFGVIICDGIEIATFRGERYAGDGNDKNVDVEYVDTIGEDLSRRDLTINAIAIDINGNIIDPYHGVDDIHEGVCRFVGNPYGRIHEDFNRILRACRFAAKFDLIFERDTLFALINLGPEVKNIKPERIKAELVKAMDMESPSRFFKNLVIVRFFDHYLKEMGKAIGHTGGKHHSETVWEHLMAVGDALSSKDFILRLAGFLHDIGKPKSWDGERFVGHEKEGQLILLNDLKELKFSNKEIEKISGLSRAHMYLLKDSISSKSIRKLRKKLQDLGVNWKDLVRLRIADAIGNFSSVNNTIDDIRSMIRTFTVEEDQPLDVKSLSVSGGQLIKELELTPGPVVGEIQRELFEFFLETGVNDEDCLLLESVRILKNKC